MLKNNFFLFQAITDIRLLAQIEIILEKAPDGLHCSG